MKWYSYSPRNALFRHSMHLFPHISFLLFLHMFVHEHVMEGSISRIGHTLFCMNGEGA